MSLVALREVYGVAKEFTHPWFCGALAGFAWFLSVGLGLISAVDNIIFVWCLRGGMRYIMV